MWRKVSEWVGYSQEGGYLSILQFRMAHVLNLPFTWPGPHHGREDCHVFIFPGFQLWSIRSHLWGHSDWTNIFFPKELSKVSFLSPRWPGLLEAWTMRNLSKLFWAAEPWELNALWSSLLPIEGHSRKWGFHRPCIDVCKARWLCKMIPKAG